MIFIETWQILPNNVHTLEQSIFKDLQLLVTHENHDQITDVITRLYHKYIWSNAPKTGNLYQKTNPAVFWILNTTGCWRWIVLACLMYKIVLDDRINREYYSDNCIYNHREAWQVPVFQAYDMIAKLGRIYANTREYSNFLFSSKG